MCVLGEGRVQVHHSAHVEIRSQFVGAGSLLQPRGLQGSKSGPQGQQQVIFTQWATGTATYIPNSKERFQSFYNIVSSNSLFFKTLIEGF